MTSVEIAAHLKKEAIVLGFTLVGIAPAARPDTLDFLHEWLQNGHHGEMGYLSRREEAYAHPAGVFPDVRSLILLAFNYTNEQPESEVGKVAKYAAGMSDYHDLLRARLKLLAARLQELSPGSRSRAVIDTAPLLERDFARRAGIGWFGKNTMLINKREGSYFFLGGLLTDLVLPADQPHESSHCGTCTRCLDACPTQAFDAPYVLDARKCISYLTIELRNQSIPEELRTGMQDWIFGCDVCQDVCPWNRRAKGTLESALLPVPLQSREAVMFLQISEEDFKDKFKTTPLSRTGRVGMARNAAIALGNTGDSRWIPVLRQGEQDDSPIVRESCVWAIAQIENVHSRETETNEKRSVRLD